MVRTDAGCSRRERACRIVHVHRRRDRVARARAQRCHIVLEPWHRELLDVLATRTGVEVVHRHRHQRLARQHQRLVHLCTTVPRMLRRCTLAHAFRLGVHSRAVARTAIRKAGDPRLSTQMHRRACDTARCRRTGPPYRHAQIDGLVACKVHARKRPLERVQRRVIRCVRRPVRQLQIEVGRAAALIVQRRDVDVPYRRCVTHVWTQPAQVAV